tara:strand:- start:103 stop:1080 length:978 start_codon:yes stop_codon:yes gene_type:complete
MKRLFSLLLIFSVLTVQPNYAFPIFDDDDSTENNEKSQDQNSSGVEGLDAQLAEMKKALEEAKNVLEEAGEPGTDEKPNEAYNAAKVVVDSIQKKINELNSPNNDDGNKPTDPEETLNFHEELKKRFIEGDPKFMVFPLLCLILGLAIAIERIIYLNLSTTDSAKLTRQVEEAMKSGGVEEAKEICRNTPGPVASIFYQGLDRSGEGLESAEKALIAYGGVQMGQLEKNVSWVSLFIALAPMLGFMGTVIGMITAFDKIEAAGDMQPSLVAGGIKVALLTTVFGLIVAIILQVFYNYIIAKIDSIVNDMENASIDLMDILVNNKK